MVKDEISNKDGAGSIYYGSVSATNTFNFDSISVKVSAKFPDL